MQRALQRFQIIYAFRNRMPDDDKIMLLHYIGMAAESEPGFDQGKELRKRSGSSSKCKIIEQHLFVQKITTITHIDV